MAECMGGIGDTTSSWIRLYVACIRLLVFGDIFLHRLRIWPSNFRCWSAWTPWYGHDTTSAKLVLFSTRPADLSSSLNSFILPRVSRVMRTVLLVLADNRLLLNHRAASITDFCRFVLASANYFPVVFTALPSATILLKVCAARDH